MPEQSNEPRPGLAELVSRIETATRERREADEAIAGAYRDAKAGGFDPKALKALIAKRGGDAAARSEQAQLVETYERALETGQ